MTHIPPRKTVAHGKRVIRRRGVSAAHRARADANAREDLARQQESLRSVIESISGQLELRPLLTRIVRHACELLGAARGSIGLVDEERGVIRTEAIYRMPPEELGAEVAPGVGLAGRVFATQQPLLLDRYGDVDRPMHGGVLEDAVVGIPIFWRERMIGFFGIGSPPPRRFGQRDADMLSLFARHAAIAIANARRYEWEQRRTERLTLIARIGRIITADLQLDDLLQNAADAIHELLGYPYISIAVVDRQDPESLVLAAVAGGIESAATKQYRLRQGQGIVGVVAQTRQVILVNDVASDPRYVHTPSTTNIRSELAIPILSGDQLLGVLNIESDKRLTEEDNASLQIIADQLAVAAENARLYTSARQALAQTRLLYQTSHRISTAMDVDEVVRAYLELVAARTSCACWVALYPQDAEGGPRAGARVRGRWSPPTGITLCDEPLPYPEDTLAALLDAGQPVAFRDVLTDTRVSPGLRRIQTRLRSHALALIPLLARGQRIGVVVLSHSSSYDWPEEMLETYQATAAQLATAIDSRRQHLLLFERGQQVAVLEERQRLARDLHDSVTQLLFSVTLIAQSLSGAWKRDPVEGERRVDRLLELSRSALAETRALLAQWRPATPAWEGSTLPGLVQVRQKGLATALQRHCVRLAADGLKINLDTGGYTPQPWEHEEAIFRITQEALHNVVKHARVQSADVCLAAKDGRILLTVRDEGKGFDKKRAEQRPDVSTLAHGGLGLATMRERAEALGGTLCLQTAPNLGTLEPIPIG